jgi:carbon starvation protein CstA
MEEIVKDQLGATCSGLCIVHCLAVPVILAAGGLGALGEVMASKAFHVAMLLPVALFALISFPGGYCRHRRLGPGVVVAVGLSLLVIAQIAPHHWERLITSSGGLLIVAAHLTNHRYSRAQSAGAAAAKPSAVEPRGLG